MIQSHVTWCDTTRRPHDQKNYTRVSLTSTSAQEAAQTIACDFGPLLAIETSWWLRSTTNSLQVDGLCPRST